MSGVSTTKQAEAGVVVAARGLTKRYGDVTAVDQVSLHVERGEVYALLGLNGAGKTTTIRMLLGMVGPSGGVVSLLGMAVQPDQPRLWSRVGYLVESPAAYPELTVRENLEVVRRLRRVTDRRAVDEVMSLLDLTAYAGRRTRTLSLGNAQRLGLAKALIHRPELLILDEPANGLDPAGVVEVRGLLRRLAEERAVTVVLSSHILAEVARLASRVGIIHEGRLLQELDAQELASRVHRRLVVGARDPAAAHAALVAAGFHPERHGDDAVTLADEAAIERPDDVATLLVRAACAPTRLVVEREDLEAYFLRLVGAAPGGGDA